MRLLLASLFLIFSFALAAPDLFADFIEPLLEQPTPTQDNGTSATTTGAHFELFKRQLGCASGYAGCGNLNAPGLCCRTNQVCSADAVGNIACCPLNAACTGTIRPVTGAPTISVPVTTTQGNPFATITTTAQPSFVQSNSAPLRSMVPNSFYPFAFIPTTYNNAAACSSAYTTCQSDAASCTAALANGVQGVTITAPNGGTTITAIPSLGSASATSICQSLSSLACYGLDVRACQAFGNGNTGAGMKNCGYLYGMGAAGLAAAGIMLR